MHPREVHSKMIFQLTEVSKVTGVPQIIQVIRQGLSIEILIVTWGSSISRNLHTHVDIRTRYYVIYDML
jgi:hypothetical protein